MQVHLSFRDMEPSPAVEARVRERAARLERYFDRITACRVVIESPHHHHHKGQQFHVRVDLTVPEGTIIADRRSADSAHEDVYVAIRDAFDTAGRELEEWVRRRRGDVKHHTAARRAVPAEE